MLFLCFRPGGGSLHNAGVLPFAGFPTSALHVGVATPTVSTTAEDCKLFCASHLAGNSSLILNHMCRFKIYITCTCKNKGMRCNSL